MVDVCGVFKDYWGMKVLLLILLLGLSCFSQERLPDIRTVVVDRPESFRDDTDYAATRNFVNTVLEWCLQNREGGYFQWGVGADAYMQPVTKEDVRRMWYRWKAIDAAFDAFEKEREEYLQFCKKWDVTSMTMPVPDLMSDEDFDEFVKIAQVVRMWCATNEDGGFLELPNGARFILNAEATRKAEQRWDHWWFEASSRRFKKEVPVVSAPAPLMPRYIETEQRAGVLIDLGGGIHVLR